jgi:hypothetical protein
MYHSDDLLGFIEKAGLKTEKVYENIGVSHTIVSCMK